MNFLYLIHLIHNAIIKHLNYIQIHNDPYWYLIYDGKKSQKKIYTVADIQKVLEIELLSEIVFPIFKYKVALYNTDPQPTFISPEAEETSIKTFASEKELLSSVLSSGKT